jgi:hypothetical protein
MNEEAKQRLATVLNRKASLDEEAENRRQAQELARNEESARKEAARARWTESLSEIKSAVDVVNAAIRGQELTFELDPEKRDESPAISQLSIKLIDRINDTERSITTYGQKRLVLNVNAFGRVTPVLLIPHSGKNPPAFDIENADREFYENILVEFLDQAIQPRKR